jgi:hypothetical protein
MVQKNERVELEMKIMKYRAMARSISDDVTTKRIATLVAELEQKLKEIDEYGRHEVALRLFGTAPSIVHWFGGRWQMPHYFFDIKVGHRLVDRAGSDCKNDSAAFEKARVLAIAVSLDKPAVDPTRRISVLNADRTEISSVAVYSKPTER